MLCGYARNSSCGQTAKRIVAVLCDLPVADSGVTCSDANPVWQVHRGCLDCAHSFRLSMYQPTHNVPLSRAATSDRVKPSVPGYIWCTCQALQVLVCTWSVPATLHNRKPAELVYQLTRQAIVATRTLLSIYETSAAKHASGHCSTQAETHCSCIAFGLVAAMALFLPMHNFVLCCLAVWQYAIP